MEKNKVVYIHRKATDGTIFYVGIGNPSRAKNRYYRNRFWKATVKKHGHTIHIIERNISWKDACESEIALIELIGRRDLGLGTLVNLTDGGDGATNTSRRIRVIDLNNGKIYDSIIEASKTIKMTSNHLVNCLNGKERLLRATHLKALNSNNEIQWTIKDDYGFSYVKNVKYSVNNWTEKLACDLDACGDLDLRNKAIHKKPLSKLREGRQKSYNHNREKVEKLRDYIKKIMF